MYEQYSSQEFEEKYTYSGNLGAFWTPEKTTFRLWAPTAEAVSIRLYRSGDPGADDLLAQLRMQPDVCGTWTAERFGNLNGIYYTYVVTVDGQTLTSSEADVDTDPDYTPDTEAIVDGYFAESTFRSAPYFDLQIDGINLLDTNFGG